MASIENNTKNYTLNCVVCVCVHSLNRKESYSLFDSCCVFEANEALTCSICIRCCPLPCRRLRSLRLFESLSIVSVRHVGNRVLSSNPLECTHLPPFDCVFLANVYFPKHLAYFHRAQRLKLYLHSIRNSPFRPIRLSPSADTHHHCFGFAARARTVDEFGRQRWPSSLLVDRFAHWNKCQVLKIQRERAKTKFYFWKMEALSGLVKVTLPNYLSNLPIPDSFTGWFRLGCKYEPHIIQLSFTGDLSAVSCYRMKS